MRWKLLILLQLLSHALTAQLTIAPGEKFFMADNSELTLQNVDMVNDGNFTPGNSLIRFNGNSSTSIGGTQPLQFSRIEINKTNNSFVILKSSVEIRDRIIFHSGFFDLNGFDADLGTTGLLDGEHENSRVIGANGGEVGISVTLNSPSGSNPANLGVFISSDQNLGNVIIKRGHQSQSINSASAISISRYYDIRPANNTNLNATLRFTYFEGELNGLDENSLELFKSDDGINWSFDGVSSRKTVSNFVEKTNLTSLSRFTLFALNSPLPVIFTQLNAHCEGSNVVVTWKTAQEQNSDHFDIQRSNDGVHWAVIGSLRSAGNSSHQINYTFSDNGPGENNFYRVAEYDIDGSAHYTGIVKSICGLTDELKVWPNPFRDKILINITTASHSQATLKIYDDKGSLIKVQTASLLEGSNQLRIDLKSVPKGIYELQAEWNNGQMKKTIAVMSQ